MKKASTGADGKMYFVPNYNYPWGCFYRKSLWAEKGYEVTPAGSNALRIREVTSGVAVQAALERVRDAARDAESLGLGERALAAQSVTGLQPSGPGRKWKSPSDDTVTPPILREIPQ